MVDQLEKDTELTLGLPGGNERPKEICCSTGGHKRGFVETVDLDLLSSNGKSSVVDHLDDDHNKFELLTEATSKPTPEKVQVIGWPPVRSYRNNVLKSETTCNYYNGKYVKVAADGAPFLRKLDLETFTSYQHLFTALNHFFSSFNYILYGDFEQGQYGKLLKVKGMVDYVPTYEDKDGDLMLVGDVPWKMFTESCKRIRLMKSSESIGLAPSH